MPRGVRRTRAESANDESDFVFRRNSYRNYSRRRINRRGGTDRPYARGRIAKESRIRGPLEGSSSSFHETRSDKTIGIRRRTKKRKKNGRAKTQKSFVENLGARDLVKSKLGRIDGTSREKNKRLKKSN